MVVYNSLATFSNLNTVIEFSRRELGKSTPKIVMKLLFFILILTFTVLYHYQHKYFIEVKFNLIFDNNKLVVKASCSMQCVNNSVVASASPKLIEVCVW